VTHVKSSHSEHRSQWLLKAPLGLLLIGLGFSIAGDAVSRKGNGQSWFWRGTIGLVLMNAGVSVVGDAVRHRTMMDVLALRGE
jgi:hypothetical protein